MSETEALETHVQELRRGTIVLACLRLLARPGYGYGLLEELSDRGFDTDANTLYPLLRRLEKQGHLTSEWNTDEARPRKFYRTSAAGHRLAGALSEDFRAIAAAIDELPRRTDMNTSTLTDRYVDAATRTIPEADRAGIAAELRERIADELDGRLESGIAPDAAERAVLNGLGDPDKLAAEYIDRPLHLIGPRYYLTWWRLLKLLWAIVPACAAFGVALGATLAGDSIGQIIGAVVPVVIQVIVNIGFWTTLVFFIIERSTRSADIGLVGEWTVDRLPEIRANGTKPSDLIASLVFLALAAGGLVWDHFVGFVPQHPGLSFFDDGLWPWWIGALFVLMLCEGALAVIVYRIGRWTIPLAAVNALLALAVAVPALVLLSAGELLNPDYFTTIIGATGDVDSGRTVDGILAIIVGFVIAGTAVWDIIDVSIKALRARR